MDSQNATLTVLPHYDLKNCKRRTYFVHKKRTFLAEYFPLDTKKARVTALLKHFPVSFEKKTRNHTPYENVLASKRSSGQVKCNSDSPTTIQFEKL